MKQKLPKLCNIRQKRPWGARAVVAVAMAVAVAVAVAVPVPVAVSVAVAVAMALAGRVQAGRVPLKLSAKMAKTV